MSDGLLQPCYADSFRCTGSECEESCCQAWGVYVDKATYKKYRATPGLRQATGEHIELNHDTPTNFRYARIKFGEANRCPFLAEDKLCSIQKQYGAEFLSKTCARYPRALVRFEGRMQKALYLSCPEACRLVLSSPQLLPTPDRVRYHLFRPAAQQTASPAVSSAELLRDFALDLLQDPSYPFWQRLFLLSLICRRVHELNAADQVALLLAQYATILQEGNLRASLDAIPARPGLQLDLVLQLIQRRFQIEQPHHAFAVSVADFLVVIGHSQERPAAEWAGRYHQAYVRCYERFSQANPHFMENYALNYLFRTRFPYADAPGQMQRTIDPLTSSLLLVLHYRLLHSLLIGAAARYGDTFSSAHAVRVVHAFGRTIEHHVKFMDALLEFARSPDLQQSDGLAVLLKN